MAKYDTFKFRCSSLPTLMTESRKKGDISETTKAKLEEMWIESEYGRKRDITSKYTEKGLLCEQDSMDLLYKKTGKFFTKNRDTLSNDYLTGTPDIVDAGGVYDVKSSWDLWTFTSVDEKQAVKDYGWQVIGYMILTGKTAAHIVYALNNTPEQFITDELYKMSFRYEAGSDKLKQAEEQVRKNMTFDDIPPEKRTKIYSLVHVPESESVIQERVQLWRNYMNTLAL